ncbi:hypothetical protein [Variovorax sp. OV084]|uniref:hypothetical protein n=1 Tax=Variovorax sp. OV084 TaxID=1882777 RepID=UPI0008D21A60|nr:hypothetical protein [Variovorax sp. OV084]SES75724.1 hypothetical protein SAMN05443580_101182 [Variovorax sp. OV084]
MDEDIEAISEQAKEPVAAQDPAINRDGFLQLLCSLVAASDGGGLPVTLSINGMLVSGTIISAKAYFSAMAQTLANGIYQDEKTPERAKFEQDIANMPNTPDGKPPLAEGLQFIHLRDAKFLAASGESMNVTSSVLWRGRISKVAGWSFGAFSKA